MASSSLPGPRIPVVDQGGLINAEWYRYFVEKERIAAAAADGEVQGGAGLSGGGPVSGGVTLSIAANGIANAMLREGLATSVIGRFQGTDGDVADIQASADNRVLGRFGGQLVFYDLSSALSSVPFATYTVATLPAATPAGRVVYASDGRNAGEGAGVGTGSIVVSSGTIWHIPGIAAAVAA